MRRVRPVVNQCDLKVSHAEHQWVEDGSSRAPRGTFFICNGYIKLKDYGMETNETIPRDERDGPYKVVSKLVTSRETSHYSIILQTRNTMSFTEFIPDAGFAETARHICNLLNREHKRLEEILAEDIRIANDQS